MTPPRRATRPLAKLASLLLSEPDAEWHGYALHKRTGLGMSTLYPLLDRLEGCGWLSARWSPAEQAGLPPKRLYRLTAEGGVGLRDALDRYNQREPMNEREARP